MPKLLLFVPCERAIVDKDDNRTTLVCLLEQITVAVELQKDTPPIPEDAVIPISWTVIALWQAEPGDLEKTFEIKFELTSDTHPEPSTLGVERPLKFEPDKPNYRHQLRIQGFPLAPILRASRCVITLLLREQGKSDDWLLVADFSIIINKQVVHK